MRSRCWQPGLLEGLTPAPFFSTHAAQTSSRHGRRVRPPAVSWPLLGRKKCWHSWHRWILLVATAGSVRSSQADSRIPWYRRKKPPSFVTRTRCKWYWSKRKGFNYEQKFSSMNQQEGFNMIASMNNWCESVSKWNIAPKWQLQWAKWWLTIEFGGPYSQTSPILIKKTCSICTSKKGDMQKNKRKEYDVASTLRAAGCLKNSSNRIRPSVHIIAPLRALCVALLYVLPNDKPKSLKSSNVINLLVIRGFFPKLKENPWKTSIVSAPIFPFYRELKFFYDLWVNPSFLATHPY